MILDVFLDASLFPCMRLFHVVWVWVGVVGGGDVVPTQDASDLTQMKEVCVRVVGFW